MVSILIQENVHHFIIYTVTGTFFGYGLVYLVYRWLKLDNPRLKAQLLFIPLIIPISTYVISYVFHVNSRCLLTTGNTGLTILDRPITGFCTVSNAVAIILTPLFVLAISMAIIKAGVSLWACRRLVKRNGLVYEEEYPTLITTLKRVSNKVGVTTPDLIMTDRKYAQCFTFGFRNPVIVLSKKLVEILEQDELEAVLAHEVAHIMRKDSLFNWVAQFLRDAMLFSPVVVWGFNKMVNETEKAADDITIRITEKPLAFAQALIKVWRMSPKSLFREFSLDNFSPNPGFATGVIGHRVQRVIDAPEVQVSSSGSAAA
ncbi:MAG: M48 family metalloprotease [Clostridia bacterium]|nr:M48 family metalloprotease [Clostridia bacterium]